MLGNVRHVFSTLVMLVAAAAVIAAVGAELPMGVAPVLTSAPPALPTNSSIYAQRKINGWCGPGDGKLPGLDDSGCIKRLPSMFTRDWRCPIVFPESDITSEYMQFPQPDTRALPHLKGLVADDVLFTLVEIKRLANGTVYSRYLSNGNDQVPFETWSSSKVFASSNAARKVRNTCTPADGVQGLSSREECANVYLGDMMTIIASYDDRHNLSSNALAGYMHSIGGHQNADGLIHEWLQRPITETFGGNYGEPVPAELCWNFTSTSVANVDSNDSCAIIPDYPIYPIISNTLSSFTMAEWLKRLALHREIPDAFKMPDIAWQDVQDLLYGKDQFSGREGFWPYLQWGGMTMDTTVYVQQALENVIQGGIETVDAHTLGGWRIFGKLGFGYTTERDAYEGVLNTYVCLPAGPATTTATTTTASYEPREFILSVRSNGTSSAPPDGGFDARQQAAVDAIVKYVMEQGWTLNK